ncbi:MAG: DUF86 domain-containing protein [Nanoarchaeota archaeon]|nr:DUF86 domain-containing protein [Nanoarchaeota archaeon]
MARIEDKKEEIQNYLEELGTILPRDFEEYQRDYVKKAACERYFERIIGAVTDLAFIFIKENKLKIPEEEKEIFDILVNEEIIKKDLGARLKDARGMRNIIAHQYGKVDDEIVFESITSQLIKDIEEFMEKIV